MHGVNVAELGGGTVGVNAAEGLDVGFDDVLEVCPFTILTWLRVGTKPI